jgi:hypothetical protein
VALSRPGNHAYIVRHEPPKIAGTSNFNVHESDSEPQEEVHVPDDGFRFSFHTGMVPARSEEVAKATTHTSKYSKRKQNFVKEDSIFDDWTADSEFVLSACFKHDCSHAKFGDFIKSVKDFQQCESSLRANYSVLKKMFICLASRSCFPCIDWESFSKFCIKCELVDDDLNLE